MTWFARIHQLRTSWMAWWLALALVVAPVLGRMHEVLHAPEQPITYIESAAGLDLFAEHSELVCLVLDQLCLGVDQSPERIPIAYNYQGMRPGWYAKAVALPVVWAFFEARAPPHMAA